MLAVVGAFTPQKSANTTNQDCPTPQAGCRALTSTPWLLPALTFKNLTDHECAFDAPEKP